MVPGYGYLLIFDKFTDSFVVTAFVLACFLALVRLPFVSSFLSFLPFSFFSLCRSLSLSLSRLLASAVLSQ